jgi:hypothetical protein
LVAGPEGVPPGTRGAIGERIGMAPRYADASHALRGHSFEVDENK